MRQSVPLLAACLATGLAFAMAPRKAEPLLYDLVINGESFTIEADRSLRLESKKDPGVVYEVALRIAQNQRLALNRIQFDYDRGYEVTDDHSQTLRSANMEHELGFTITLTDLGRVLNEDERGKILQTLQESMENSFRQDNAENLKTTARQQRFQHAEAEGVTIQYHDTEGRARTCLIYVLAGKDFTASAIVQFPDANHEDVLPLVKRTLDSVQAR